MFGEFSSALSEVLEQQTAAAESSENTRRLLQESPELSLASLGESVGSTVSNYASRVRLYALDIRQFLTAILGSTWEAFAPSSWSETSFDWSTISNLRSNFSSAALQSVFDEVTDKVLVKESFQQVPKPNPACYGPSVTLSYVPKKCVWPDHNIDEMICEPANITVSHNPGGCDVWFTGVSLWHDKAVRARFEVGFTGTTVIGGDTFQASPKELLLKAKAAKLKLIEKKW